jgi:phosphoribosylaminoimidazole carboxylase PurE protein
MESQKPSPIIGVTMGSDTDLATLRPGLALLDEIGIPYECTITSAHRTPQHMLDYAKTASSRGLKCIIAAAGGAAHLPGMLASCTSLPVIGVPVKASSLDGLDSLLSIVQMPRGVPVGTMSIGNSVNAALYAARIVGNEDERVRRWVEQHLERMDRENMEKKARLEKEGWKAYEKKESSAY